MKKLSQRVAALTPSITGGLILLAVGLTALLAYRAFDASRAQRQLSEGTLREYAGFAAFQLKNATVNRLTGQPRAAFDLVILDVNANGTSAPLGATRAAELIGQRGALCRCLGGVSFYYQVTFADSAIDATASDVATPDRLRWLRDTVIAQALGPTRPDAPLQSLSGPRPPGAPLTSQYLVSIFSRLGDRPYVFTQVLMVAPTGAPLYAYGIAVPAEQALSRKVKEVLATQAVLPATLTRDMKIDSILDVTVRTPARDVLYQSRPSIDTRYAATDSVEPRFGGLKFEVAINPAVAGRLIIGGLPRSRLPEVLATAFLAVGLLGLLLFQFRRQEELGRLRDDFVSGVSHELRTPLAQIRLLAELLHMGKVPVEERERSLRIIDKEARRLSFLVDSILNFTHTRREGLALVSTDVASEIDEIVRGFEPLAHAQGVQLTTRLERGIVAGVDRGAIRQVLLNLLDNAVRYGPAGQNVTVETKSAGRSWMLEVTDEGPGIPTDERERIFAPYYRMKRDAGGAVGGTGIGLAVVRRLVEEHNGRVQVVSTNGNGANGNGANGNGANGNGAHAHVEGGARFVVTLPIEAARANG